MDGFIESLIKHSRWKLEKILKPFNEKFEHILQKFYKNSSDEIKIKVTLKINDKGEKITYYPPTQEEYFQNNP